MDNKKRGGKFLLFGLYSGRNPLFYKLGVLVIFALELSVMYIIQNNFGSAKWQAIGLILLAVSLFVINLPLYLFLKEIKREHK